MTTSHPSLGLAEFVRSFDAPCSCSGALPRTRPILGASFARRRTLAGRLPYALAFGAAISAAVASPVADLSRTSISFGSIGAQATSTVQPVFVTNVGDSPLNLSTLIVAGSEASDFSIAGTCAPPITLAPGARCRIDVTARILSPSPVRSATLEIGSDSSPAPGSIELSANYLKVIGTGFMPQPAWIDFADQPVGTPAATQTFALVNPETAAAVIESVAFYQGDASDFTLSSDCVGRAIANGSACNSTIGFVPTSAGPRSTELLVRMHPLGYANERYTYRYSITGFATAGGFSANQHGVTGSWYRAATSGQGVEVEVFPDAIAPGTGFLQGSWFTFDHVAPGGAASQRWYTFSGSVASGRASGAFTLYQNVGGNFNGPPVTSAAPVGSIVMSFTDCTSATMEYRFDDGSARSGSIAMTRLTPNVSCSDSGPPRANADFGYSGNWFDPKTSGQGIVVEVNPAAGAVFFAWYTYAPDGQSLGAAGQRWYTGQGTFAPGARSLPLTLYETTGGLFQSSLPAANTVPVGTGTLSFGSCSAAQLAFAFTAGSSTGRSGAIALSRVGPVPSGCGP